MNLNWGIKCCYETIEQCKNQRPDFFVCKSVARPRGGTTTRPPIDSETAGVNFPGGRPRLSECIVLLKMA